MSKARVLVFYSWGAEPLLDTNAVTRESGVACLTKRCMASFAAFIWDDAMGRFRYEVGLMFTVHTPLLTPSITSIVNVMWMLEEHIDIPAVRCVNPANGHVVVSGRPRPDTRVVEELVDMATTMTITLEGRNIDYCRLADRIIEL